MNDRFALYLFLMALVTYLLRAIPMVLIKKPIQNRFVLSFLKYVPYAVLSVMTVPAIFFATNGIWSALIGFLAAFLLAYLEKDLLTVAIGASAAVFLTEFLMKFI